MEANAWWVVLIVVLAFSALFGMIFRSRAGTFRAPAGQPSSGPARIDPVLLRDLGVHPTATPVVTLLQFSSRMCTYCRATRLVCAQIAAGRIGVRHVEVDAEQHLAATRSLGILRTPTLLVIDPNGVEVSRAGGLPVREAIERAVDDVTGSARPIRGRAPDGCYDSGHDGLPAHLAPRGRPLPHRQQFVSHPLRGGFLRARWSLTTPHTLFASA